MLQDLTEDLGQVHTKLAQINEQQLQENLSQLNAKKERLSPITCTRKSTEISTIGK